MLKRIGCVVLLFAHVGCGSEAKSDAKKVHAERDRGDRDERDEPSSDRSRRTPDRSDRSDRPDRPDRSDRSDRDDVRDAPRPRVPDRDDDVVVVPADPDPPRRTRVDDDEPVRTCGAATTCSAADDCPNIVCRCEDGKAINAKSCHNGCCLSEAATCADTCASHDGPSGTWNAGRDGLKTGDACRVDRDCASSMCVRGLCTKKCSSFGDCPSFWDCEASRSGDKLCVKH